MPLMIGTSARSAASFTSGFFVIEYASQSA